MPEANWKRIERSETLAIRAENAGQYGMAARHWGEVVAVLNEERRYAEAAMAGSRLNACKRIAETRLQKPTGPVEG
jgi:hypothetical protein